MTVANAYTGGTVINGGVVSVSNNNQLGAAAGGVTLERWGAVAHGRDLGQPARVTLGANGGTILSTAGDGLVSNPSSDGVISGGG